MSKSTFLKIVVTISLILTAVLVALSVNYAKNYFTKKNNHQKVLAILNDEQNYSRDSLKEEVEKLNSMLSAGQYYDTDLGLLYEKAGHMYMLLGEEMTCYRYLGYSLYYLEQSEEKEHAVNIYLDLTKLHIYNRAYDSAEEMINHAIEIEAFEDINNHLTKCYANRVMAQFYIETENYKEASAYLNKADKCIDSLSDEDENTRLFKMINQIMLAKMYAYENKVDDGMAILNQYNNADILSSYKKEHFLYRDLVIPYYQTQCLLIVEDSNSSSADSTATIESFINLCQENNYEKIALDTLIKIQEKIQENNTVDNKDVNEFVTTKIDDLSKVVIDEQSQTYSAITNGQINDSRISMAMGAQIAQNTNKRVVLTIISIVITCFIILFFVIIILHTRRDGLTFLYNRRTFNTDISRMKRLMASYSVIMLDIDNFKHINDTYGHPAGDKVLQKVGQYINNETSADIKGYRYGGEEFAIILNRGAYVNTMNVAETIRRKMETSTWSFDPNLTITVSLGIASGSGSDDVVKKADENLYYSKQHGKNQIYSQ